MDRIKVSFVKHCPGHKDSKGNKAEWCIVSHETGKILSSHSSESAAKEHLKQMHIHKGVSHMRFINIKTIDELFKKADGMTTFYRVNIGYPYADEYEDEVPTLYNSIESSYNAAINLTKERFGNKFNDSIKKSIQDVEKELLTEGRSNVVVGEEELIDEEYGKIASYAVIDKVTVNIVK